MDIKQFFLKIQDIEKMIDTIEKLTSGGVGALRDLLAGERSSERRVGAGELGSDFVII